MQSAPRTIIRCRGLADAHLSVSGDRAHPAALLIERAPDATRVLAIGADSDVRSHPGASDAGVLDLPDSVVIPGLINAHTHLDLTVIGPQPHDPDEGFVAWVGKIRAHRAAASGDVADSVRLGAAMSRAGGVVAVGDIAGAVEGSASLAAAYALQDTELAGVSFVEFFAIGPTERDRFNLAQRAIGSGLDGVQGPLRLGIQPHAPNTVSLASYQQAAALAEQHSLPIITHLAESPEERDFIASASGRQRDLLESLGLWTPDVAAELGRGKSPIEHLSEVLHTSPTAGVHVNQCSDADLRILSEARTPVVYCPRASAYFGAEQHFGPHRYRDMLAAGLTVAIGTDSVVNLPAGSDRISPLDEARFLARRDGTAAPTLIAMMTTHGARVLGMPESGVRLSAGSTPIGLVAVEVPSASSVDPRDAILASNAPPRLLFE